MREALDTLPWVEQGSVQVKFDDKLATFKVVDPKKFSLDEVNQALGDRYHATVLKTGSAIPTQQVGAKPAAPAHGQGQ